MNVYISFSFFFLLKWMNGYVIPHIVHCTMLPYTFHSLRKGLILYEMLVFGWRVFVGSLFTIVQCSVFTVCHSVCGGGFLLFAMLLFLWLYFIYKIGLI